MGYLDGAIGVQLSHTWRWDCQNQKASWKPFHFAIPYSFLTVATASPAFPVCLLIQVTNISPEFLQVISTTGYHQEAGTHRHFR